MANTTSGTTVFEKGFSISDIVEEAYERLGIQGVSGYQLKSARRSLNILFQEWANRGLQTTILHLLQIKQHTQCLELQQMVLLVQRQFMVLMMY
jgi:hypothetical protein